MNIDFEELHVFDNSKSKYVPREMYEKAQADADRRLKFMRYVEKHKKVCMFCYTRYHTDDCKWAKELADAK